MKKLLLATLSLVFTFCMTDLQAQVCVADTAFVSMGAGVYPLPDPVGSAESSLATGCVNVSYEQPFTVVVPDSISALGFTVALGSVEVLSIAGLPDGVTYACDPQDCKFLTATTGCLIFTGTPTVSGTFKPIVSTNASTGLGVQPISFPSQPGEVEVYPGEYVVNILESGDAACPVSIQNPLEDLLGVSQNAPNPFSTITNITIDSKTFGQFDFKVYSLIGEMIHNESFNLSTGENTISFDGTHLNSGMYFYSISQGNDIVTKRMIINK